MTVISLIYIILVISSTKGGSKTFPRGSLTSEQEILDHIYKFTVAALLQHTGKSIFLPPYATVLLLSFFLFFFQKGFLGLSHAEYNFKVLLTNSLQANFVSFNLYRRHSFNTVVIFLDVFNKNLQPCCNRSIIF